MPALRIEPNRRCVFAGKLDELRAASDPLLRHAGQVGSGVFHTDDIGQLGQLPHCRRRHVDHRARRNVVDDDRDTDLIQGRKMRDQPALRRLVVIGGHHQSGRRADGFRMFHKADRLDGVVRPRTGDHRHPASRGFHHGGNHLLMLVMGQGRAFAGRPHRHQPGAAFRNLPLHQFLQRVKIHCAVRKRRDQCGH